MQIYLTIIHSKRKSILLQIREDLSVEVRAPLRMSDSDIKKFVSDHGEWISRNIQKVREHERRCESLTTFTEEEIRQLKSAAGEYIPSRVRHYSELMGVTFSSVSIRMQKTLWGSCSSSGRLSFNCLLMKAPAEVIDYVVVHELSHRKHMNHSDAFWALVEKYCPSYRENRRWLRTSGALLMRMSGKMKRDFNCNGKLFMLI